MTSNAGEAGELAGERHESSDRAERRDPRFAASRGANSAAAASGQRGGRQHDAGRAEPIEQRNQDQAAGRRADQIGGVDRVDVRRQPRDGQRDAGRR